MPHYARAGCPEEELHFLIRKRRNHAGGGGGDLVTLQGRKEGGTGERGGAFRGFLLNLLFLVFCTATPGMVMSLEGERVFRGEATLWPPAPQYNMGKMVPQRTYIHSSLPENPCPV